MVVMLDIMVVMLDIDNDPERLRRPSLPPEDGQHDDREQFDRPAAATDATNRFLTACQVLFTARSCAGRRCRIYGYAVGGAGACRQLARED
jgi:hypothetical protein